MTEFKKWFAARARNPDRITLEEAFNAGKQSAPSVPDGWRLVPIDPTQNMLDCMDLGSNMLYRYRALLAAAPKPEVE